MVLQGCRNAPPQLHESESESEVGSICRKAWGVRPDPKLLACWKSRDFCHFCDNVNDQFLWTGQTFGSSEKNIKAVMSGVQCSFVTILTQ